MTAPGGDIATSGIAFSPDGQTLVTSAAGSGVVRWSVAGRHEVGKLAARSYIKALAYRPVAAGGSVGRASSQDS